jgi:hypothetical protein
MSVRVRGHTSFPDCLDSLVIAAIISTHQRRVLTGVSSFVRPNWNKDTI